MVNRFIVEHIPAKQVLCHEYVLEQIRSTGRSRMTGARTIEIASFRRVRPPFQFPFALSRVVPVVTATLGLQLLDLTTPAEIS